MRRAVAVAPNGWISNEKKPMNTIEASRILQGSGLFNRDQADAIVESQAKLLEGSSATKADLLDMRLAGEARLQKIENDLGIVKWMCGLLVAGVIALVMKAFF